MGTTCVIFDADGVVIKPINFAVSYEQQYGISDKEMKEFFQNEFQQCILGKADLKEVLTPWLAKWNWNGTTEEFLQFWFSAEHNIDEEVVTAIQILRNNGILCYLATNQEKYRLEYMKEKMGFGTLFHGIFSSCTLGYKKPDTGFYTSMLDQLEQSQSILAENILFFDDSEKNVETARLQGISSYIVGASKDVTHRVQLLF